MRVVLWSQMMEIGIIYPFTQKILQKHNEILQTIVLLHLNNSKYLCEELNLISYWFILVLKVLSLFLSRNRFEKRCPQNIRLIIFLSNCLINVNKLWPWKWNWNQIKIMQYWTVSLISSFYTSVRRYSSCENIVLTYFTH